MRIIFFLKIVYVNEGRDYSYPTPPVQFERLGLLPTSFINRVMIGQIVDFTPSQELLS